MSVEKLKPPTVTGFPAKLWNFVKLIATRVNRPIEVIFATDSKAAIAKVEESDEKITITLPMGAAISLPKPSDNSIYLIGYKDKKLQLFSTQECEES